MIHLETLSYPDHIIVDAAPHPDPVRDEDGRVDGEVDEEVELDPRLGVAVEHLFTFSCLVTFSSCLFTILFIFP